MSAEVSYRINEASKCLGGLRSVMRNRRLEMSAKRRLYEGVVVPTVLYGAETWNLREVDRKKLNVFEMKCLRSMVGVSIRDRFRNEEVRDWTGITSDLAERSDRKLLRWFGHVEHMDESRCVKRVWKSEVTGRRPRGRPRMRWMDGVKRALNARGLTVADAVDRVGDRSEWRAIVSG